MAERLTVGVAARLSRYLQVLTQAKKMGKDRISSQEISDYTNINATQIRRDLSGFGKFGKRGVGYNVDSLVQQIRKILRSSGQHNIALFGAGHLGKAIASSDIFADHGFNVVGVFDTDRSKVGEAVGTTQVRHLDDLDAMIVDEDIVVGVIAVPTAAAQARPSAMAQTISDWPRPMSPHTNTPSTLVRQSSSRATLPRASSSARSMPCMTHSPRSAG